MSELAEATGSSLAKSGMDQLATVETRDYEYVSTLGYFTPLESEGLLVLPYHRMLSSGPSLDEARALYEWNYKKQLLRIQATGTHAELLTLHPGAKPTMRTRDQVMLAAPALSGPQAQVMAAMEASAAGWNAGDLRPELLPEYAAAPDDVRAEVGQGAAGFANAVLRRVADHDLDGWLERVAPEHPDERDPGRRDGGGAFASRMHRSRH